MDTQRPIAAIFLQGKCNMVCTFCVTEDAVAGFTFAEAEALVRGLRAAGVRSVILGGGEPLAWPHDVYRLAAVARGLGQWVQVGTNGLALPEGFASRPEVDRYILPLESLSPAVHDSMRTSPRGHHAVVMGRIRALVDAGKEFTLSTMVGRPNAAGLGDLAAWLEGLSGAEGAGARLHAWHLYRFLPVGRGGAPNRDALSITESGYRDACAEASRRAPGLRIYRRPDMLRSKAVGFYWMEGGRLRGLVPPGLPPPGALAAA